MAGCLRSSGGCRWTRKKSQLTASPAIMIFGKGVVGLFREEGRKKTDSAGDEYLSISTFVDILSPDEMSWCCTLGVIKRECRRYLSNRINCLDFRRLLLIKYSRFGPETWPGEMQDWLGKYVNICRWGGRAREKGPRGDPLAG